MIARTLLLAAVFWANISAAQAPDIIEVTYNSDPPGATLFEADKPVGIMPHRGRYAVGPDDRAKGFKKILPVEARWASGAKAPLAGPLELPVNKGPSLETTFVRPKDAPGLAVDLQLADRLARADLAKMPPAEAGRARVDDEARRNREAAAGAIGDFMDGWAAGRRASSATPPTFQPPLELRCRGTGPNQVDCTQR